MYIREDLQSTSKENEEICLLLLQLKIIFFSQFNMNSSFSNFFWYPGVGEFGHFFLPYTPGD